MRIIPASALAVVLSLCTASAARITMPIPAGYYPFSSVRVQNVLVESNGVYTLACGLLNLAFTNNIGQTSTALVSNGFTAAKLNLSLVQFKVDPDTQKLTEYNYYGGPAILTFTSDKGGSIDFPRSLDMNGNPISNASFPFHVTSVSGTNPIDLAFSVALPGCSVTADGLYYLQQ